MAMKSTKDMGVYRYMSIRITDSGDEINQGHGNQMG